ncbi:TM2 domain-containing protein [Helicobacter sp. MIT 00-7814]|nr:TM2 domain-containing protein [Helicobacter sp. MIT 00-7814]RDU57791.1 TM2 domain-containing protein [Helicobacter sp. MIT 99-10781]
MQTQMLFAQWGSKIPDTNRLAIQQALEKVPDDKIASLSFIPLKDPIIGLILGLFFGVFGVDRFYKGDIALGVAKLLFGWVTLFIWNLLDLYFVWSGIKKDNFYKIMQAITFAK